VPVTVASDRRFRRAHVKPGRQRRSWLSHLWLVLRVGTGAAVLLGVGYGVSHGVANARVLQISTIRVRGNQHLAQGEVLALLAGLQGQHILATDLDVWRQKLLVSPWIEQAALRRVLPSTVEVAIRERRPMALARLGSTLYLVAQLRKARSADSRWPRRKRGHGRSVRGAGARRTGRARHHLARRTA